MAVPAPAPLPDTVSCGRGVAAPGSGLACCRGTGHVPASLRRVNSVSQSQKRVLVLGLGNDILTDDVVGIQVAREVRARLAGVESVEVRETTEMGLALLDFVVGYHALVLVDSIQTGKAPPGFIHELDESSLNLLPGPTPHFLGVGETLALGRGLGMPMPERVKVLAVEVQDPFTIGTQMTPPLQGAMETIVERVAAQARELATS
jgi:hydrogenase maturation protease